MTTSQIDHGGRQPWWKWRLDSLPSVLSFALALFVALMLLGRYLLRQAWIFALSFAGAFALVRLTIDLFLMRRRRRLGAALRA